MKSILALFVIYLFVSCTHQRGENLVKKSDSETVTFTHGVASGDPLTDRVIIWTRAKSGNRSDVTLNWQVATDKDFNQIVKQGTALATKNTDHTVKVDVIGLHSGTKYFYRFMSDGVTSPIGKTQTFDNTGQNIVSLGIVSCSNFQFGYFSAYRHLAEKDIDIVLHLGDYFYEHGPDGYGDPSVSRKHDPSHEIISLQDYRKRYAQYRNDNDLQLIHQKHPFIAIWDDHEITNNAYKFGAQNHQDEEGDYLIRRTMAKKAYYEWMPIRPRGSEALYRSFDLGPLADIIVLDERLEGRTEPVETPEEVSENESMLGVEQLQWFKDHLTSSDAIWKIVGNQVIFSQLELGKLRPESPKNLDAWDGYAVERDDIIRHIDNENIEDVVFVTGDTHCSWAFEVPKSIDDYKDSQKSVAIEFGTPSVTSSNWNDRKNTTDAMVIGAEKVVKEDNPHLKFVNARDHGYMVLTLSLEEAKAEWYYMDDIKSEDSGEKLAKTIVVKKGITSLNNME